jgi:hypothetical protein
MKVVLNIDEEIFDNEVKNKFNDFWNRVIVDLVDDNFENLCGQLELETASMLQIAFKNAEYKE